MNPHSVGNLDDTSTWPTSIKEKEASAEQQNETPKEPKGEGVKDDEDWEHLGEAKRDSSATSHELIHQTFLLNNESLVRDILLQAGLKVKHFVRFELGEELSG